MNIQADKEQTVIFCKHYDREYASAFHQDADADEMIIQLRNLLSFMTYGEETIDYIMGVDNEV